MKKVAIVYDTVSGSTRDMAEIISDELQEEFAVTNLPAAEVASLAQYDSVVIGSPMRFGRFTAKMRKLIRRRSSELAHKRVAYFFSVLYVVRIAEEGAPGFAPYVDPGLAMSTIPKKKTTGMDRTHSLGYYARLLRRCAPEIEPVAVAYLKGRLVLSKLPFAARMFMRAVTALTAKEQEGEFLNPTTVRNWAAGLRRLLA